MLLRKSVALFLLGLALLFTQPSGHAQAGSDALTFFQNYFLTGDYVVGGVGLRGLGGLNGSPAGLATNTITINSVPADADIVAAFLYWQVVSTSADSGSVNATFDGNPLSTADGPLAKVLTAGTAACWTPGGGSPSTYTSRADVRRFLPADANGRLLPNGSHIVQVPDSGPNANQVPMALGASLVLIYRDPRVPLKAVVLYDGGYTMNQITDSMSQTIRGFYQASTTSATLTHIVSSGPANRFENLEFNNSLVAANPFQAVQGDSWDNYTANVTLASLTESPAPTTSVDHAGLPSFGCLSWSAIVFSTAVQDTDGDGLLDIWESSLNPLLDPNNHPLPNLNALGANPNHKDLFVEIGYMHTDVDTTYGGVLKPAHSHLPDPSSLKMVGDAFKNAPIHNPDSVDGVNVHFDVGGNYQGGEAGPYVIPQALARGGEAISENVTVCPAGVCEFPLFPGTVGWKVGYKFYRDQLLSANPPALDGAGNDPCDVTGVSPGSDDGPGGLCERRFDRNRMDMFHYVLGAHFIGLPKSEFPCLDDSIPPVPVGAITDGPNTGLCAVADNPDFHIPRTSSGVADFPGGDLMLTLGGFSDAAGRPVGTPFMQAATLLHELGHNFDLSHSGVYQVPVVPPEPNCKPNYLSSMNYLFQLRGLFNDDPLNPGVPHLDYSSQKFKSLDENNLVEKGELGFSQDSPFGLALYHTGWYALEGVGSPATKHCDGSPLLRDANGNLTEPPMFRVDGPARLFVDWDQDNFTVPPVPQDLNFDGTLSLLSDGADDWATIRLNQLATRRNVLELSIDAELDSLGRGDTLGRDGLGRDGLGRDGLGRDGLGRDGLGRDGLGRDGLGRDGLGRDGLGRDGLGRDGLGLDGPGLEEVDTEIAAASGNAPPNSLTACQIGIGGCVGAPSHRVKLTWKATNINPDQVFQYIVSRYRRSDPAKTPTVVGQALQNGTTDYSLVDTQELPNDEFVYYAVAAYIANPPTVAPDPCAPYSCSGQSNLADLVVINDAPVANNDSYNVAQDTALNVGAPGVLGNDTDDDSGPLTAAPASSPSHGSLTLNGNGSFTYTPTAGYVGPDAFTYTADDVDPGNAKTATVSITVTAANHAPVANNQNVVTNEDTAKAVMLTASDLDSNPLTYSIVTGPSHGALSGAAPNVTYTPSADYNGPDSFTFKANDGTVDSNVATVSITVNSVNDAPSFTKGANQAVNANTGTKTVTGWATAISRGPANESSQTVNFIVTNNNNGLFSAQPAISSTGTLTFKPAASAKGVATVSVQIHDNGGTANGGVDTSAVQNFTITVNLVYGLINVQNLPPSSGTRFTRGTTVPLSFKLGVDEDGDNDLDLGDVVNSSNALPLFTITGPAGTAVQMFTPAAPGRSTFQLPSMGNGYTWTLNWKTVDNTTGVSLPAGTYTVVVTSQLSGQTLKTVQIVLK